MTIRLFVPKEQFPLITGDDVHYLRDVMRVKAGEPLELFDGGGKVYAARIAEIKKGAITCEILSSRRSENEPAVRVTLAQALTRAGKMDFIVEKTTELSVARIIPVTTERTQANSGRLERWRKIAKEAAEQSGRAVVPEISLPVTIEAVLKLGSQYDLALIAWEAEKTITLKRALTDSRLAGLSDILITTGPEGGFSPAEIAAAKSAGFIPMSLGKRILRAETAGLAALAAIIYELDLL